MEEQKTCTSCGMSVDSVSEDGKCTQCAPTNTADNMAEGSTDTAMGSGSDMAGEGMTTDKAEEGAEKTDATDDQG